MEYNLHCQGDEHIWSVYLNLPQQIARLNGKPAGLRFGSGENEGKLHIDPQLPKGILGVFTIDRTDLTFQNFRWSSHIDWKVKGQCRRAPPARSGYQL